MSKTQRRQKRRPFSITQQILLQHIIVDLHFKKIIILNIMLLCVIFTSFYLGVEFKITIDILTLSR